MKSVTPAAVAGDPQVYEDQHVHTVYDQIAPHFSSTRYKPWPIISKFISDLPAGWIGLDSGTGNGKYLPLPVDRPGSVLTVGLDRSRNLLLIAKHAEGGDSTAPVIREVIWGDVLGNGWRAGAFDYAISIATIHHLASHERRRQAVQRLLQCVSPTHGRVLIYVWAVEQDELSKRAIPAESIAGKSSPLGKDVFVPWVLSQQGAAPNQLTRQAVISGPTAPGTSVKAPVYHRYYHLFAKGELMELTRDVARGIGLVVGPPQEGREGIEVIQDSWERSNYYVELRRWKT